MTEDYFFLSHFADRALAAKEAGFEVVVAAHEGVAASEVRRLGLRFAPISFRRGGLNLLSELATLRAIVRLYRDERPDIVHHVALKPIIYGTIAGRRSKIVNAPVGMGFVFTSSRALARILRPGVRLLLRLLLNPAGSRVVFENRDDLNALVADGTVRADEAVLIRGAGVDISQYTNEPEPQGRIRAVFASRMLRDKGVVEFVDAARILRAQGRDVICCLVGSPDSQNPTSLRSKDLQDWHDEGVVEWLGQRSDIASILAGSHIVVLPSYREGLPKILLEAMAAGRSIVASDVPGCREAVSDGHNGLLVPPRDAVALATALARLIDDDALRQLMGRNGRRRAETEFSSARIVAETLSLYETIATQLPDQSGA